MGLAPDLWRWGMVELSEAQEGGWWLDDLVLRVLGELQTGHIPQTTRIQVSRKKQVSSSSCSLGVSLCPCCRDPNREPEMWFAEPQSPHPKAEDGRAALELMNNLMTSSEHLCVA